MSKKIPKYIYYLFWDVNISNIDINQHASFIIRRVLDYGDAKAINWLRRNYPEELIIGVVKNKRGLLPKTITFWNRYYKLKSDS
ncbi:MAG: hypothetical protein ABIL44_12550 [candidate division WOR-3 bacterium]